MCVKRQRYRYETSWEEKNIYNQRIIENIDIYLISWNLLHCFEKRYLGSLNVSFSFLWNEKYTYSCGFSTSDEMLQFPILLTLSSRDCSKVFCCHHWLFWFTSTSPCFLTFCRKCVEGNTLWLLQIRVDIILLSHHRLEALYLASCLIKPLDSSLSDWYSLCWSRAGRVI